MPPKKAQSKATKTGSRTAAEAAVEAPRTCILCCQKIVEVKDEVLYCKGKCNGPIHRYCAGVSVVHYESLRATATPQGSETNSVVSFLCLVCMQQEHRTEVEDLRNTICTLRTELQQMKDTVTKLMSTTATIEKSYAMAAATGSGVMVGRERGLVRVDGGGRGAGAMRAAGGGGGGAGAMRAAGGGGGGASGVGAGGGARGRRAGGGGRGRGGPYSGRGGGHLNQLEHGNAREKMVDTNVESTRQREVVSGARRVWGTLKSASHYTVKATIIKLTSTTCRGIDALSVKRKSMTTSSGKLKWWFVLHGDEGILSELAQSWETVSLQTSWRLESCTKPVDTIGAPLSYSLDSSNYGDAVSDATTIPSLEPVSIATPLSTNGHNSTTMGDCGQNLDRETPKNSNVCQPISVSPGDQDACDTSPSASTIVSSPSASTNDPIVQAAPKKCD